MNNKKEVLQSQYRYDAFLSYAHEDKPTVEWLHKLLTKFWVPWKFWAPWNRRRHIFMDQESLPAGGLSEGLKDALNSSRFLIVCCSKASAESHWVNEEIREFLISHPAENVRACFVGPKISAPFAILSAMQTVENSWKAGLFKPDLRGHPEGFKGRELKMAANEALALLAPLLGLRSKDELLDRRKKNLTFLAALLLVITLSVFGWVRWIRSDAYQIRAVMSAAPQHLNFALPGTINDWLLTLVIAGRVDDAFTMARGVKDTEYHYQAFIELANALNKLQDTVRAKKAFDEAIIAARRIDTLVSKSMAGLALVQTAIKLGEIEQAFTLADEISLPEDQALALATIADYLFKNGKLDEAVKAANRALVDWHASMRKSGGVEERYFAPVYEILVKVGKPYEAMAVLSEIKKPESRCLMQIVVSKALAKAGSGDEAKGLLKDVLNNTEKIGKVESKSYTFLSMADALSVLGEKEAANEVINKALAVSREDKDLARRFFTLRSATKLLNEIGNTAATKVILDEALTAYPKIEFPNQASAALVVTELLLEAERTGEAFDLWCKYAQPGFNPANLTKVADAVAKVLPSDKILIGIQGIVSPSLQSSVCAALAESLVKAGKIDVAYRTLTQAQNAVQEITNEGERSGALSSIARAEAKLGLFLKARQSSEQCLLSDKLTAYIAILREYYIKRNPSLAKLLEGEQQKEG